MSNELVIPKETQVALTDRGLSEAQWRVLKDAIFPTAESTEAIMMAVDYCKARNLDIFKKPVHIVPVWSKAKGRMVETVWPGISEIRTTAARTGQYAGKSAPVWGPDVVAELGGVKITYPEWCEITVNKLVHGHLVPFTARVYWLETYATAKKDTKAPNAMWAKRTRGQLSKCCEAEALREAFPEEVGGEYAAEEMSGQALILEATNGEAPAPPTREQFKAYPFVNELGELSHMPSAEAFVAAMTLAVNTTIAEMGDVTVVMEANEEALEAVRADKPGIDTSDLNIAYNTWRDAQDADRAKALEVDRDNIVRQLEACSSLGGLAEVWNIHQATLNDMRARHQAAYKACVDAKDKAKDAFLEQHPANA